MKKLLVLFAFMFVSITAQAKIIKLNVYVDRVIDGDTIVVEACDGLQLRIRFAYIDAYEAERNKHILKQEKFTGLSEKQIIKLGLKAKEFVYNQINHKEICIELDNKHLTGAYGRYLAQVYTKPCSMIDSTTLSLNSILLIKKLATPYNEEVK